MVEFAANRQTCMAGRWLTFRGHSLDCVNNWAVRDDFCKILEQLLLGPFLIEMTAIIACSVSVSQEARTMTTAQRECSTKAEIQREDSITNKCLTFLNTRKKYIFRSIMLLSLGLTLTHFSPFPFNCINAIICVSRCIVHVS